MAATLSSTGTWTALTPNTDYVGGVGVAIGPTGGGDFDSRASSQTGKNGFPEFWQFIALMAANMLDPSGKPITTLEAMDILRLQLSDARRQPQMGERAYAP